MLCVFLATTGTGTGAGTGAGTGPSVCTVAGGAPTGVYISSGVGVSRCYTSGCPLLIFVWGGGRQRAGGGRGS